MVFFVLSTFIPHWIAIYPVDTVIHPFNNRALGAIIKNSVSLGKGKH